MKTSLALWYVASKKIIVYIHNFHLFNVYYLSGLTVQKMSQYIYFLDVDVVRILIGLNNKHT